MKEKSESSRILYRMLMEKGYSEEFSNLISQNLNTDFTAGRMIGYLSHYTSLPEAEIVDEMLSILSDRNRIMQKKEMEATNARWNGSGSVCNGSGQGKYGNEWNRPC